MKKLFSTLFAVAAMMIMVSCGGGADNAAAEKVQAKVEAEGMESLTEADIDVAIDYMEAVFNDIKPLMQEGIAAFKDGDTEKAEEIEQEINALESKYPMADQMVFIMNAADLTESQKARVEKLVNDMTQGSEGIEEFI